MPSTSAGVPPPVTPPPVAAPPLTSPSVRAGMALIPGGGFIMGAPEGAGASDEHPQHKVWLDAFYLDTDEVSVEEYRKFCAQTDRPMPEQPDWSSPRHPVVNVSWHNADAFCRHRGQRLPTEAQWERGALCGGTRRKSDAPLVGNMVTTDPLMKSQTAGSPWPVGTKGPNPCGFFDSVGNVWEWVSDWYSANYYDQSPRRNPAGPAQGEEKVLRGGAVLSPAAALTGTFREKFSADYGAEDRGFRCAAPASD